MAAASTPAASPCQCALTDTSPGPGPQAPAAPAPAVPSAVKCVACGVAFASRAEHRAHSSTAWHVENVKARWEGRPRITEADFAALSVPAEAPTSPISARAASPLPTSSGVDEAEASDDEGDDSCSGRGGDGGGGHGAASLSAVGGIDNDSDEASAGPEAVDSADDDDDSQAEGEGGLDGDYDADPRQCLACRVRPDSVADCSAHMRARHGFELPAPAACSDVDGALVALGTRVYVDHVCLSCLRRFTSAAAVQAHMKDAGHCQVRLVSAEDVALLRPFYSDGGAALDVAAAAYDTSGAAEVSRGGDELCTSDGRVVVAARTTQQRRRRCGDGEARSAAGGGARGSALANRREVQARGGGTDGALVSHRGAVRRGVLSKAQLVARRADGAGVAAATSRRAETATRQDATMANKLRRKVMRRTIGAANDTKSLPFR